MFVLSSIFDAPVFQQKKKLSFHRHAEPKPAKGKPRTKNSTGNLGYKMFPDWSVFVSGKNCRSEAVAYHLGGCRTKLSLPHFRYRCRHRAIRSAANRKMCGVCGVFRPFPRLT